MSFFLFLFIYKLIYFIGKMPPSFKRVCWLGQRYRWVSGQLHCSCWQLQQLWPRPFTQGLPQKDVRCPPRAQHWGSKLPLFSSKCLKLILSLFFRERPTKMSSLWMLTMVCFPFLSFLPELISSFQKHLSPHRTVPKRYVCFHTCWFRAWLRTHSSSARLKWPSPSKPLPLLLLLLRMPALNACSPFSTVNLSSFCYQYFLKLFSRYWS